MVRSIFLARSVLNYHTIVLIESSHLNDDFRAVAEIKHIFKFYSKTF